MRGGQLRATREPRSAIQECPRSGAQGRNEANSHEGEATQDCAIWQVRSGTERRREAREAAR
eukprot:11509074-Alexandrium_andersonii.AAC.1